MLNDRLIELNNDDLDEEVLGELTKIKLALNMEVDKE